MRFFLFCLFSLAAVSGFSNIRTIHSFKEAEEKIRSLSKDSLVIFDVDEVLITPADAVLKPAGGKFNPDYLDELTPEKRDELLSVMLDGAQYALVDPNAPAFLSQLADQKINAIGLTACRTGIFGVIPSMEDWRCDQLHNLDLHLNKGFFKEVECEFPASANGRPLFKEGILFCGNFSHAKPSSKGDLLGYFFDQINWTPDEIVFFDDLMKNLLAVQNEADKRGIPFQGYLFESDSPEIDETIADMQFRTAMKEKKWLSDNDAKIQMAKELSSRAVVFDWGNVLAFNSRETVVDFLCQTFHLTPEEFEAANHQKRLAVKSGLSDVDFWIRYAAQKNIDLPSSWPFHYDSIIKKSIGADPEMFALIEELKGKKIKVGLLSNIDDRYTGLIRKYGYYEPFEPCLLSCEIGLAKPDAKIYEKLLQEMRLAPEKIVFIDDIAENVDAAKQLGIDAILFQSPKQIREELTARKML